MVDLGITGHGRDRHKVSKFPEVDHIEVQENRIGNIKPHGDRVKEARTLEVKADTQQDDRGGQGIEKGNHALDKAGITEFKVHHVRKKGFEPKQAHQQGKKARPRIDEFP